MRKLCSIVLISFLILVPVVMNAQAQAKKRANKDTEAFRYELEVVQTGTQGSYLVKVWSYSKKSDVAILQAKKNAVHGVIFKGFAGITGVEGQKPMCAEAVEEEKGEYFDKFFADAGGFLKFVNSAGDGGIAADDRLKVGKEYKIGVVVSVNVTGLRQELEAAGIIKSMSSGNESKPSIMVFPSDVWMTQNKFTKTIDNQGSKVTVMDYESAMQTHAELNSVITLIGTMFLERGFPLEDLGSKLKDLKNSSALDNMDQSSEGGGISESPRDMLLKTAKPDIAIEISWTLNTIGLKKSVTFDLKGLDAGTNKQVASAGGTGNEVLNSVTATLLKTAVLANIDNFNALLMKHFEDIRTNGREINLDIKVFDGSPKKLNDEIGDDGDELKDVIKKWVSQNTVKGSYKLANASNNFMKFEQVRIPLFDKDGGKYDSDSFAKDLKKYIRKIADKIPCESEGRGLGKAQVTIGGKR